MPRKPRVDFPGAIQHVCGHANGDAALFRDDRDRRFFLRRLKKLCSELGIRLISYCLMTTHYHLMLETGEVPLKSMLQRLETAYARVFNDRWKVTGHTFNGRYFSRLILDDADAMGVVRYIHKNPVKAGMVRRAEDWPWSSHSDYLAHPARTGIFDSLEEYLAFMLLEPAVPQRRPLEELALSISDLATLRSHGRTAAHQELRREFVALAIAEGYRQSDVARFMGVTRAAVAHWLRAS